MLLNVIVITVAAFLFAILYAILLAKNPDEDDDGEDEPGALTRGDPRCMAVAKRLEREREAMRARGTPLLIDEDRPHEWSRRHAIE